MTIKQLNGKNDDLQKNITRNDSKQESQKNSSEELTNKIYA